MIKKNLHSTAKTRVRKALALVLCVLFLLTVLTACGEKKKTIVIYSSSEDFRNNNARQMLEEKFPEYNIQLEYQSTGNLAAKLAAEGKDTDADIILELEASYMEKNADSLATLDKVDFSVFLDELVPESHKYVPWTRLSGAIIVNTAMLAEKNIPVPTSYDDLLDPAYKGLISMPSPKSSGTGYIFYLNLVNERGEEAAVAYFDKLAANICGQGFTTSGSGPVTALVEGEAAIGLGMTFQAVKCNNEGSDFEILFFAEGSPYTTYCSGVIAGKETDADVMKVFDYIVSDVTPRDKELYSPEPIYKDKTYTMENFPENVPYGDMTGILDMTLKEQLLDKWNH